MPMEDYIKAFSFSARYQQLKDEYRKLSFASAASPKLDSFGSRSSIPGDSVGMRAIKMADIRMQMELIEDTIDEVTKDERLAKALLASVGYCISYDKIGYIGISKSQFYRYRRRYYYLLSAKLKGDET